MGCLKSKLASMKKKCTRPPKAFYARQHDTEATTRLSGEEVLKQLQEEGIVPSRQATGGVAFSLPAEDGNITPRGRPPRRLARLPVTPQYTREERHMMAEIIRFDRLVEQVQRKALDRDCKRRLVLQEKDRQDKMKKFRAKTIVTRKDAKAKKFEEERKEAKKMEDAKKEAKRKAVVVAKKSAEKG